MIDKFIKRLRAIGIDITLSANYPWIYVTHVNGNYVTEKFMANHGFTAFTLQHDSSYKLTDRRAVFKLIRSYL